MSWELYRSLEYGQLSGSNTRYTSAYRLVDDSKRPLSNSLVRFKASEKRRLKDVAGEFFAAFLSSPGFAVNLVQRRGRAACQRSMSKGRRGNHHRRCDTGMISPRAGGAGLTVKKQVSQITNREGYALKAPTLLAHLRKIQIPGRATASLTKS